MTQSNRLLRSLCAAAAALAALFAAAPAMADPDALRASHNELREQLRNNPYGRAMHIVSSESDSTLQGEVYAVLDYPFARVNEALRDPAAWCDILLLPFNTKYCHAVGGNDPRLVLRIGRKYDQPVEQAFRLALAWRNVASSDSYLESRLSAREGPFGTRDYRIAVEAIPLGEGRSFMHLSYAYGYGTLGRIAMQGYLGTVGADKVGFSVVGKGPNGEPQYITGVRAAVERNAMRYYLAIDSYLDSLDAPKNQQVERRIQRWFSSTERYPRQLHEMDRGTYVTMKRAEYERQQTASIP
jgi:hypothetical protein